MRYYYSMQKLTFLRLLSSSSREFQWRWMRRATVSVLPVAWMYRTMTVGELDEDGLWLREELWAPRSPQQRGRGGFWRCTSRDATINRVLWRWLQVLTSAVAYAAGQVGRAARERNWLKLVKNTIVFLSVRLVPPLLASRGYPLVTPIVS